MRRKLSWRRKLREKILQERYIDKKRDKATEKLRGYVKIKEIIMWKKGDYNLKIMMWKKGH